jgi:hypothetical protein
MNAVNDLTLDFTFAVTGVAVNTDGFGAGYDLVTPGATQINVNGAAASTGYTFTESCTSS